MKTEACSSSVPVVTNERLERIQYRHALGMLILPPLVAAMLWIVLPSCKPGVPEFVCFLVMYSIAGLGVDIGLHRYFTHRSFACRKWLRPLLAITGMMAAPGTLLSWVATHRQHHDHSDHVGDPHSPYVDGRRSFRGLWHAHAGWLFHGAIANPLHYAPDIVRDPLLMALNRLYLFWVAIGLIMPFCFGLLVYGTAAGALNCLLWGGAIRIFVEQHVILSINSLCHFFGTQSYHTRDESRNNHLLAIPSFGEAFHNNHHAYPSAAIFGHRWWEIDIGGYVIRLMQMCGLAWDVKTH